MAAEPTVELVLEFPLVLVLVEDAVSDDVECTVPAVITVLGVGLPLGCHHCVCVRLVSANAKIISTPRNAKVVPSLDTQAVYSRLRVQETYRARVRVTVGSI